MKTHILLFLLTFVLLSCEPAQANWFDTGSDLHMKLSQVERQLKIQQDKTHEATQVACFLGIGCVLFLIIGTAVGAKTRHDAATPTS